MKARLPVPPTAERLDVAPARTQRMRRPAAAPARAARAPADEGAEAVYEYSGDDDDCEAPAGEVREYGARRAFAPRHTTADYFARRAVSSYLQPPVLSAQALYGSEAGDAKRASAPGRPATAAVHIAGADAMPRRLRANPLAHKMTVPDRTWAVREKLSAAPVPLATGRKPAARRARRRVPASLVARPSTSPAAPPSPHAQAQAQAAAERAIRGVAVHYRASQGPTANELAAQQRRVRARYALSLESTWRRRTDRSPFLVDLVAERARIEEENRLADYERRRRARVLAAERARLAREMALAAERQRRDAELVSEVDWQTLLDAERVHRDAMAELRRRSRIEAPAEPAGPGAQAYEQALVATVGAAPDRESGVPAGSAAVWVLACTGLRDTSSAGPLVVRVRLAAAPADAQLTSAGAVTETGVVWQADAEPLRFSLRACPAGAAVLEFCLQSASTSSALGLCAVSLAGLARGRAHELQLELASPRRRHWWHRIPGVAWWVGAGTEPLAPVAAEADDAAPATGAELRVRVQLY